VSSNRGYERRDYGIGGYITPAVRGIIIANIAVFIVQELARRVGGKGIEPIFALTPELAIGSVWVWQFVTYMFLHSTSWIGHLFLNMLMLWMFGCEVERQWGSRAFLRYYFVCGIGAGLVSCLTFYSSMTYGASGAIFGVMLAYAMVFPNRIVYFWWIFPMRAMTFVLLCAGIEMYSLLGLQDGVAHTAHLGGMLAGWLDLKRAWRVGNLYKDLKWRWRRRRLRVLDKDDRRYPFH
jgi:membrane associated rhomboid family serine protease